MTVEFVGAPSERLDDWPWLAGGARTLAQVAGVDHKKRPTEDLLADLAAKLDGLDAKAAKKAFPPDGKLKYPKNPASLWLKRALLHRHDAAACPPPRQLLVLQMEGHEGNKRPQKGRETILLTRLLWEQPNHPLQAKFDDKRILAERFSPPASLKLHAECDGRGSRFRMFALGPAELFETFEAGQSFGCGAWS